MEIWHQTYQCQVLRSVNKAHVMFSFGCEGHPIFGTNRNTIFYSTRAGDETPLWCQFSLPALALQKSCREEITNKMQQIWFGGMAQVKAKTGGYCFLPGIVLVSPFACRLNFDGRKHQLKEILTTEEGLLFTYTASIQKVHPKKGKHCCFRFYTMCRTRLS